MINSSGSAGTIAESGPSYGPRHSRPAPQQLSAARASVLRAIDGEDGPVTVSVLAQELGGHPNTVREHLDALVASGWIERVRSQPAGRGRPAWLYQVRPGADVQAAGLPGERVTATGREYAALAVALIDQVASTSPDPRSVARSAGERWGRTLMDERAAADAPEPDTTPNDEVVNLLRDLRFESEPATRPDAVRLTTCPILDAARRNPDVVCQVHLGIVRGVLDRLGGDPDSADLEAFAEPGACLLTLREKRGTPGTTSRTAAGTAAGTAPSSTLEATRKPATRNGLPERR